MSECPARESRLRVPPRDQTAPLPMACQLFTCFSRFACETLVLALAETYLLYISPLFLVLSDTDLDIAGHEDAYSRAFNNNSTWRRSLAEQEPELFEKLGKGQAPQILWIGCADSRCPETTILGLQPGEIFCHRNIANILTPTDLNSLSVIQFAVQYLKVKHIIICGHTSCGGIAAALDNKKLGLIDTWLMPLRTLRRENLSLLEGLTEKERGLKLVELNVRSGIKVLLENPTVDRCNGRTWPGSAWSDL